MTDGNLTKGILLQGRVSEWTGDIIREYKKKFPYATLLVQTWNTEKIDDIPCEVIQIDPPKPTYPHTSTVNHQILGTNAGLRKIQADVILKCRTDQFIHNNKIFEFYEKYCPKNKIMVPDAGTYEWIPRTSDFCQLATKEILLDFWSTTPLFDGSFPVEPGKYLTQHYVLKVKNDSRPWKITLRDYFYVKGYFEDFQIEYEKLNKFDRYQHLFSSNYPKSAKISQ